MTKKIVETKFAQATLAGMADGGDPRERHPNLRSNKIPLRPLTVNLEKGFRLLRPRSTDRRSSYAILGGQLRRTNG